MSGHVLDEDGNESTQWDEVSNPTGSLNLKTQGLVGVFAVYDTFGNNGGVMLRKSNLGDDKDGNNCPDGTQSCSYNYSLGLTFAEGVGAIQTGDASETAAWVRNWWNEYVPTVIARYGTPDNQSTYYVNITIKGGTYPDS